jgi:DNA polymerase-3 subunit beta
VTEQEKGRHMHIRVDRDAFVDALGPVQGVVEAKKTLPILSHLLLEANPDGVWLFGTDLDVGIRRGLAAEVVKPGAVALSAKKLYEIARELPQAPVELQADADLQVAIRCQRSSFRMKGLPRDEFPSLPDLKGDNEITLETQLFRDMLRKTLFAVSSDQTRYALTGVLVQVLAGEIRMVATDGHRLALVHAPRPPEKGGATLEALVPKKAMVEAAKITREDGSDVRMWLAENQLILEQEASTLVARLIDGQFPNYDQVIPAPGASRILIGREALQGALRRTSAIMGERTTATEFEFRPGKVVVSCVNMDLGEAHEELEASYEGDGFKVGFNARYILEFLAAIDSAETSLSIADPLSPALFRPAGDDAYGCVIMPMRI